MDNITQEKLIILTAELDPTILSNIPDVFALGELKGKMNMIKELGYMMNDEELKESITKYRYLRSADKEDQIVYTHRLDIPIKIVESEFLLQFKTDGIRFNCESLGQEIWCIDIVVEEKVAFESVCFFYNDWLEDVLETMQTFKVNSESVKYVLFANSIANDLDIS